jgi:hypothetical protein
MSNRENCKWCGFSYANAKPGREYLYHDEQACELGYLRKRAPELEAQIDRMEAHLSAMLEDQETIDHDEPESNDDSV